jgi:hypothetical protein
MKSRILIGFIILYFAENIYGQCDNCGIMILKMQMFDSSKNAFVHGKGIPDTKIYYKDSIVIVPSTAVISNEVNGVETSYEEKDIYYTYINLRAKKIVGMSAYNKDSVFFSKYNATFYEYPAFSKDSCFTKKYMNMDTAISRTWAFFFDRNNNKETKAEDSIALVRDKRTFKTLSDTVINGVSFHREKHFMFDNEGKPVSTAIPYFRCDVQDWMMIFMREKNDKGCIATRIDFTSLNTNTNRFRWISQQYEFLSRKLTPEEIEVFDAWERNERKCPVNK